MAAKKVEVDESVVAIQSQMDEKVAEVHQVEQEQAELQALLDARIQQLKDSFQGKVDILNNRKEYLIAEIRALFDQVPSKETKTQAKVTLLSGDVVVKKAGIKLDYDKAVLLKNAEIAITAYNITKEELENKLSSIEDRINEVSKLDPLEADSDDLYIQRNELLEAIADLECEWMPYVKSKEVKDFDWSSFKEKLEVVPVDVLDPDTGEKIGVHNQIINKDTGELLQIEGLSVLPVAEQVVIK